jgi:hypothetical protein
VNASWPGVSRKARPCGPSLTISLAANVLGDAAALAAAASSVVADGVEQARSCRGRRGPMTVTMGALGTEQAGIAS